MFKLLIITTNQNNSCNAILEQIQYLQTFDIEIKVMTDPTEVELISELSTNKYSCCYVHVKRRYATGSEKNLVYDPVKILEHSRVNVIGNNYITQIMIADKFWTSNHSGIGLKNVVVSKEEYENNLFSYESIEKEIGYPVIVKPNSLHASQGIYSDSIVYDKERLYIVVERLFNQFENIHEVLIEEFAENCTEYTVSVLGNENSLACSVSRLDYVQDNKIHINCEKEKLLPLEQRSFKFETEDNEEIRNRLIYHAKTLFKHFHLRDFGRFDMVLHNNSYFLLEVNACPIPGNSFSWEWQVKYGVKKKQIIALYLAAFHFRQISNGKPSGLPHALINDLPHEIIDLICNPGICHGVPECSGPTSVCERPYLYSMNDRVSSESEVHLFLQALTELLKPKFILETGTYKASSTISFAEGLRRNKFGYLVSLEIDNELSLEAQQLLEEYPVEIVNTNSLTYVPKEKIDILFLDSKRTLREEEFLHFRPWLDKNSVIIWHDSAYRKKNPAVYNTIKKLHDNGIIDYITFPTPRGLTLSMIKQ